ncbi:MAG: bifunctional riboflavin kinase/FAD synthetase [Pseudomonadota bacterium]
MEVLQIAPGEEAAVGDAELALAIGNFDGVHRGHAAVLAQAREIAAERGLRTAVLTFEPHPRSVFRPDDPPFRLCLQPLKLRRLAAQGVERAIIAPFDARLSSLSPEAFAAFLAGLGAKAAVFGADFRFGKDRAGDAEALRRLGAAHGFETRAVSPVGAGEAKFSSSSVRRALREGRPDAAATVLGDWHCIEGPVEQGDQRGRDLGFPTANQSLDGILHPRFGVYATRAEVLDGPHRGLYDAVSSLGMRPTFSKTIPNFETHLLDFKGDLYGAMLSVRLIAFLRPEISYDGVDPLIEQMRRDVIDAKAALAAAGDTPAL